jgi:diguanylate cyclase (GGDEF)-like protein/PAS domain S-box-containing protein
MSETILDPATPPAKADLEEALRKSRHQLAETQRLAHIGSWELDLASHELTWSDEIYRIFEIDPGHFDASYEAFLGLVHPDDRDLVNQAYADSVTRREPYDYVHRLLMADGRVKYVNERGQTYYDDEGRPLRSIGTVQDITAQRMAEIALSDREQEFRLILDSASEAIYGVDDQGNCLFVNAACLRLLGYDHAGELLGAHIHTLMHHSHADGRPYPSLDCRAYSAYRDNRPVHVEDEVFWRKDGTAFPAEYWSHPVTRDGRVSGAVVTFFDITEKRQAETHLRQAAAVFDNTLEGIMITDPKGRIIAVNRALCQITGYAEAELLGRRPNLLRSERHTPAFYADMWATILATGHWQGEVWNRRKDGEVYAQLLSISSVPGPAGQPAHYVAVAADISHMKQFEASLERLAHYDVLTGLPNRLLLQSRLEHALDRARRDQHGLAVLFFDLDRFKNVNDTLGHPAGDALLQGFADRLRQRIREEDTIARLGGDEFVVVLERTHKTEQAAHIAQSVLDLLAEPFELPSGHEVYIGGSIGIALHPEDGERADELLKHADAAMYLAKEQGRGTYRFYTGALTEAANRRLHLETELRQALRRNEFILHYQPLYGNAGEVVGFEALVRWQHPHEGMIAPGHFIPVAEDSGLIVELGEWVLRRACAQAAEWRRAGLPSLSLSVNLSPRQLRQADLVARITDILRETGYDPEHLALEITEGALMDDTGWAEARLRELRALGIRLAIDDFGTGYSSLAYLKRFPVDRLKIDQSFVRDIPGDSSDMAIAATIIAMGRNLKLEVLAEGVETTAQLDFLKEQGCQLFQGYLFNRPLPAEAIPALFEVKA